MHRFALLLLSLRSRFVDVVAPAMQAFTGSDSGLGLRVLCELTSRVWVPSKGWLLIGWNEHLPCCLRLPTEPEHGGCGGGDCSSPFVLHRFRVEPPLGPRSVCPELSVHMSAFTRQDSGKTSRFS